MRLVLALALLVTTLGVVPSARAAEADKSFEARVAGGVSGRHLRFNRTLRETEREYSLNDAPSVSADGAVFPLFDARDWRNRVAIVASAEVARAVSRGAAGAPLRTHAFRWDTGARVRLSKAPDVGFDLRYGRHTFEIEPDPRLGALVPDTDYRYVRVGVDARLWIDDWFVSGRAGHRFVTSSGDLGARIADFQVRANDVELAAGSRFDRSSAVFGALRFTRYDLRRRGVSVGADDYPSIWLGIAWN